MVPKMFYPIIGLVVLVVIGVLIFMQTGSHERVINDQETPQTGEQTETNETAGEMQPSVKEFVIDADDNGFYINGVDTPSISASSGESLKITFNVRTTSVSYGGLQFGGCGKIFGKATPGNSVIAELSPSSSCTITSYWPYKSVIKDRLQISIS